MLKQKKNIWWELKEIVPDERKWKSSKIKKKGRTLTLYNWDGHYYIKNTTSKIYKHKIKQQRLEIKV